MQASFLFRIFAVIQLNMNALNSRSVDKLEPGPVLISLYFHLHGFKLMVSHLCWRSVLLDPVVFNLLDALHFRADNQKCSDYDC